ncbi:sodium:proton antiporter [Pelomyxa schiedti]|nr:sodium:proton antiporter [Pelomyxa schiedti]
MMLTYETMAGEVVVTCAFALSISCSTLYLMNKTLPKSYRLWNIPVFLAGIALSATSLTVIDFTKMLDPMSGLEMDFHVFRRLAFQSILLAGPGILIASAFYVFNQGAALAATDPVSTIATVKKLGASPRLSVLIEGEALLNDGTAIVLFAIVEGVLIENSLSLSSVLLTFLKLTGGGIVMGLVMAVITHTVISSIHKKPILEITTLITAVFSTMFISEYLSVSGVLAVVTFGLYAANTRQIGLSLSTHEANSIVWQQLEYVINSLIFLFSGVIVFHSLRFDTTGWDWLNMGILFLGLQIIRAITILVLAPVLAITGYGFDRKKFVMLWSAGLRGGVSLSLALFASNNQNFELEFRNHFVDQVIGVVFLTSVINGSLAKPLYQLLRFDVVNPQCIDSFSFALKELEKSTSDFIDSLKTRKIFGAANFHIIEEAIPRVTALEGKIVIEWKSDFSLWKRLLDTQILEEERTRVERASESDDDSSSSDDDDRYSRAASSVVEEEGSSLPTAELDDRSASVTSTLASSLFVRILKENIIQISQSDECLTPHKLPDLIGFIDEVRRPSVVFQLAHEELRRTFHPPFELPRIQSVPLLKYASLYLQFKHVRHTVTHCNGLLKAFDDAAHTASALTGATFDHQVEDLWQEVDQELGTIKHDYPKLYLLVVTSAVVKMVLHFKKNHLEHLKCRGLIDEKTRDLGMRTCNVVYRKLHSIPLMWHFAKWIFSSVEQAALLN